MSRASKKITTVDIPDWWRQMTEEELAQIEKLGAQETEARRLAVGREVRNKHIPWPSGPQEQQIEEAKEEIARVVAEIEKVILRASARIKVEAGKLAVN